LEVEILLEEETTKDKKEGSFKMKIKNIFLILLLVSCIFLLVGCWNYSEIEEKSIVAGLGIDKNKENGNFVLTVEIVNLAGKDGESTLASEIFSIEGKSVFDAVRNLITRTGRKPYWSHAKVLIIGEDIAKEGIVPILDWINRDAEVRSDIWIVASKEKTAREIFDTDPELSEIISFEIDDILKSRDVVTKFSHEEVWQFIDDVSSEGLSSMIPTIMKVEEFGKNTFRVYGTNVFKEDKSIGWLDGIETRDVLWIRNELNGGLYVISDKISTLADTVTLEILASKTKVEPVYFGEDLTIRISVETDVVIAEIDGTTNYMDDKGRAILKRVVERKIKEELASIISKVQQEYKTDIFGFGNLIERKKPKLWKEIKENWEEIFVKIDTEINVKINIKGSALTNL